MRVFSSDDPMMYLIGSISVGFGLAHTLLSILRLIANMVSGLEGRLARTWLWNRDDSTSRLGEYMSLTRAIPTAKAVDC